MGSVSNVMSIATQLRADVRPAAMKLAAAVDALPFRASSPEGRYVGSHTVAAVNQAAADARSGMDLLRAVPGFPSRMRADGFPSREMVQRVREGVEQLEAQVAAYAPDQLVPQSGVTGAVNSFEGVIRQLADTLRPGGAVESFDSVARHLANNLRS